jgi:IS4 transposase
VLFNEFIVVATSLTSSVSAEEVLETYRRRWQVEIHFKRLKSILDMGDLPKKTLIK